jgi:hypothetical protein
VKNVLLALLLALPLPALAEEALGAGEAELTSRLCLSAESAANQPLVVTLPSLGTAQRHMITVLQVSRSSAAAVAGNATLAITTTNLPGLPKWRVGNAMAAGGTSLDVNLQLGKAPLRAIAVGTATTISLPAAGAGVIWTVTACGFGAN